MKQFSFLVGILQIVLVFLANLRRSASENYKGYEIWSARVTNQDQKSYLENVLRDYKIDVWSETLKINRSTILHIRPEQKNELWNVISRKNITLKVTVDDVQSAIDKQKTKLSKYNGDPLKFNLEEYHDYDEIKEYLGDLATMYPSSVGEFTIGTTYENRSIFGVSISRGNAGLKPAIVYECGIHAREWISTSVCLYIIDQLTKTTNSELLRKYDFYVLPVVNPDGYQYTWDKNRMWRKNRSKSSWEMFDHCIGVDLNRNFQTPYFCELGASHNPCTDGYCGDFAFSEIETKAIKDFTFNSIGSRLKMYTSLHSFSQLWMYPYGYTEKPAANHQDMQRLAETGVNALLKLFGTKYTIGPIFSTIYESSGSSVDWVYDTLYAPYAFILELPDEGDEGFLIPPEKIRNISIETWAGLEAVLNAIP